MAGKVFHGPGAGGSARDPLMSKRAILFCAEGMRDGGGGGWEGGECHTIRYGLRGEREGTKLVCVSARACVCVCMCVELRR